MAEGPSGAKSAAGRGPHRIELPLLLKDEFGAGTHCQKDHTIQHSYDQGPPAQDMPTKSNHSTALPSTPRRRHCSHTRHRTPHTLRRRALPAIRAPRRLRPTRTAHLSQQAKIPKRAEPRLPRGRLYRPRIEHHRLRPASRVHGPLGPEQAQQPVWPERRADAHL